MSPECLFWNPAEEGGPCAFMNFLTAHHPIYCTPSKLANFDLLHTLLDCCTPSRNAAHPLKLQPQCTPSHPPDSLHTLQTDCTPSRLTAHPPPSTCCTPPDLLHTPRSAAHPPKNHKSAWPPPLRLDSIVGV